MPVLRPLYTVLGAAAGAALLAWGLVRFVLLPGLPPTEDIRAIQLPVPLRIFSADGKLIGEFGAERRDPLTLAEIPKPLVQAFLAAEDDRFYEHPGVDWQGLARAAVSLLTTGEKSQGGSTITMQLARNVFLSSERTFTRKAKEILLALRLEEDLSKDLILEIYLNKIYLGQRAYGVGAAAQTYFGKAIADISLSEAAVLAGLPKAPSRDNPVSNPERARERRDYVLRRMHELGFIDDVQFNTARAEPLVVRESRPAAEVDAYYVAEMVRTELVRRYGDGVYESGYTVVTTIDASRQTAANRALRAGLRDYDERHGWRGAEAKLDADALAELSLAASQPRPRIRAALDVLPALPELTLGVVLDANAEHLSAWTRDAGTIEVKKEHQAWAQFTDKTRPQRGDVVRLRLASERWRLSQVPQVQGALVALDPADGAIQALIGGYDYFSGKFNRVTQARRQPGSSFKPFLYSAALANGFTPASVILDAPVVFDDPNLESSWRPENYSSKFYGPTRLREALVDSRNLVSIRLLQALGVEVARTFATRFGFDPQHMPRDLTLALGSPSFTPLEVARGYAVFANGGFRVEPYFIREIRDADGRELFRAQPATACPQCPLEPEPVELPAAATADASAATTAPRVVEPRVVYLMRDILRDVVTRGTGARVRELGRNDLGGKTGTTNDETDAWFNGFQSRLAAVAWVGFDQPAPLGRGEVGGRAALPIWMDFMRSALRGVSEDWPERPPGLVAVRINPETGALAPAGFVDAITEWVPAENLPEADDRDAESSTPDQTAPDDLY